MTMPWLRLWNDLPNDPKLRTIARKSGVAVSAVLAIYLHVLVNANTNPLQRGKTYHLSADDIASALDLDTEQVEAVLEAMEGRLIEKTLVMGWAQRQENHDTAAAQRARVYREKQKANAHERARTRTNAIEGEGDKEGDKEEKGEGDTAPNSPPMISPEFKNILQTERPDLQAEVVFAKFTAFLPPIARTEKAWRIWVQSERLRPANAPNAQPSTADPDSRASIETLGLSLGLGRWDQLAEPFTRYKARVKGVPA